jgi:2'-5' RNA ligase
MGKTRTFVAIEADDLLRRRAAGLVSRLRPHLPSARWVSEENLHLTLMFLGDLGDAEVAEVCARTEWVARANSPFSLRVAGVGAFPDAQRPRAIWLGAAEGAQAACRLQADVLDALADLAPRGENRGFVPHWTLARLPRGATGGSAHLAGILEGLADYDAGELPIEQVVVYSSELYRGGPEYYPLATCPLGMAGG